MDKYPRTFPEEIAERIKPATIVISNIINVKPSDMDHAPHLQLLAILATGMAWDGALNMEAANASSDRAAY